VQFEDCPAADASRCHDVNRQGTYPTIQFTFLGYTFRPRKAVDKYGRVYVNFSPGVSREALRTMRQTVRGWHLQLMNNKELGDLSKMFGPVLRGLSGIAGGDPPAWLLLAGTGTQLAAISLSLWGLAQHPRSSRRAARSRRLIPTCAPK